MPSAPSADIGNRQRSDSTLRQDSPELVPAPRVGVAAILVDLPDWKTIKQNVYRRIFAPTNLRGAARQLFQLFLLWQLRTKPGYAQVRDRAM